MEKTGCKGYVIGVSGGIDSATVLALCSEAVGKDKVFAVTMHSTFTPKEDKEDANYLSKEYARQNQNIEQFDFIFESVLKYLPSSSSLTRGNLMARLRMCILYYFANHLDYLVCGTTDKSEDFIGYFTKYGGVDVEPIIHLTKAEVKQLAHKLGIPKRIIEKPSSPRLYPGHTAKDELGFSYETIDKILALNEQTKHKRKLPRRLP